LTRTAGRERLTSILEDATVEQSLVVHFDGDPVRFTPDGKVSVLDASEPWLTLSVLATSEMTSRRNTGDHELLRQLFLSKWAFLPVVDNEGWNMLRTVLMDYLGDFDFSCPEVATI